VYTPQAEPPTLKQSAYKSAAVSQIVGKKTLSIATFLYTIYKHFLAHKSQYCTYGATYCTYTRDKLSQITRMQHVNIIIMQPIPTVPALMHMLIAYTCHHHGTELSEAFY
jgi:hypothetical protein